MQAVWAACKTFFFINHEIQALPLTNWFNHQAYVMEVFAYWLRRKLNNLKQTRVSELTTFLGREFQVFGPWKRTLNNLTLFKLVLQA